MYEIEQEIILIDYRGHFLFFFRLRGNQPKARFSVESQFTLNQTNLKLRLRIRALQSHIFQYQLEYPSFLHLHELDLSQSGLSRLLLRWCYKAQSRHVTNRTDC